MQILPRGEYMAATGFIVNQAIAFRSWLGPYAGIPVYSGHPAPIDRAGV